MNIKKILVADDDIDFLNLYKSRFKPEYGYSICSFEDGKSLLKYFSDEYEKGRRIPLCILDLLMPEINGLEISIELRKIDSDVIIIIIVTDYSVIPFRKIRENLKYDIYCIRKPFNNDEFECLVDSLLKNWNNSFQLKQSQIILKESQDNLENLFNTEAIRISHMAALGELAAGVAHEVNNPIGGIINCAEILLDNYEDPMIKDISERIITAGERIAYIVKSLLSFSRKGDDERARLNISLLLSDVISLTDTAIKKEGITLTISIPEDLPDLYVHPREIQQVFLNIVNNSRYALNEKYYGYDKNKKMEITVDTLSISGKTSVRIIFFDCGTGISSDIIDKIKSPFFTTKPRGKGTGLGLSISSNIINSHNGKLYIESIKGEYTRVIIILPVEENL